jgi:diguanylate cyclase (GGDEF)-like protein
MGNRQYLVNIYKAFMLYLRQSQTFTAVVIGCFTFAVSFISILLYSVSSLISFWPAAPLLASLFIRRPALSNRVIWATVGLSFTLSDLVVNWDPLRALWIAMINLLSAFITFQLLIRLDHQDQRLRRSESIMNLLGISILSSAIVAVLGTVSRPDAFNGGFTLQHLLQLWFSWGLYNNVITLPIILSLPSQLLLSKPFFMRRTSDLKNIWPISYLFLSLFVAQIVDGPSSLLIPLPALLWCAFHYSLFYTSLLTWLCSAWLIIASNAGWLHFHTTLSPSELVFSLQLGVAFLATAPLTLSCHALANKRLLRKLEISASRDMLSGALNRQAFFHQGQALIASMNQQQKPIAVMMCDLDHFKMVNDTFGHALGDQVLSSFADSVHSQLRSDDIFGRIGGEEFAIVLSNVNNDEALSIAERIRQNFANWRVINQSNLPYTTVSIGVTSSTQEHPQLVHLLGEADRALYQAKHAGRNQVMQFSENSFQFTLN